MCEEADSVFRSLNLEYGEHQTVWTSSCFTHQTLKVDQEQDPDLLEPKVLFGLQIKLRLHGLTSD